MASMLDRIRSHIGNRKKKKKKEKEKKKKKKEKNKRKTGRKKTEKARL